MHLNICSRRKKQTTFSEQNFIGRIRANILNKEVKLYTSQDYNGEAEKLKLLYSTLT